MNDVTQLLMCIEQGEPQAAEKLLPLVYDELRRLAAHELAHEKPGQTLQATALVHEAWLRLAGAEHGAEELKWEGRRHFFSAAAEAMRRILVDNARRKKRLKHGGGLQRVDIAEIDLVEPLPSDELLALDEALTQLAALDTSAAELVKLRFFAGLTHAQAAEHLGVSRSTADRTWIFARAWLYSRIRMGDT